ncbi:MAG: tail fiber domain-containing protein, partial [Patescibacteria group bacterium]
TSAPGSIEVFVKLEYTLAPSQLAIDPLTGNVGIGTTTPAYKLHVLGDVAATGFVNISTRESKTGITYLTSAEASTTLAKLESLKVATYRYTAEDQSGPLRLGLIAEDAELVAPEILSVGGKGVDLYKLATFTLSGVQHLAAKVGAQEIRLTSLEERVTALENGSITSTSTLAPLE